ncbi:MAG: S26 family signal peptidase [Christensenellaceae bacterium]
MSAKRKTVANFVVIALFGLVAVVLVSLTVQLARGSAPNFFGYSLLFVETDSMEEAIPKQSLILVKERDFEKNPPENGEIVVFYSADSGILKTHRVIDDSVAEGYVVTKGDNAPDDDGLVSVSDIKFYHVANLTALNAVAKVLRSPAGFIALVLLPCLLVLTYLIFNTVKQAAEIKAERKCQALRKKTIAEIKEQAVKEFKEKNDKKQ